VIPDDKIVEIRERTDIVALVQEYVPLKRVGASFKGLCPFHSEKTPSFHVHPARQFFHCFGCQASGDAVGFFMRVEGRTFPEAARQLAERAGVELPVVDAKQEEAYQRQKARRERLVALMDVAAGFYIQQLKEHPFSSMAREEFLGRGITEETAADFRLGYAPHGWDALAKYLAHKGYSEAEAEEVGLIVPRKSGDGYYDRFRHRLMFPISDTHGRIVAFSGRALDPPEDEPLSNRAEGGAKYVNSPEGPLYKKGEILFGLHEGRVAIRRETWVLVCEGNFDLIALHQAGFKNAVAPMGTAFTENHARLLRRYAERAVLIFDSDKAGKKAVKASAPVLRGAGLSAAVVTLPPAEDPDSFLKARGVEALRELVSAAPGIVEHLIDDAAAEVAGDAAAKAQAVEELGPILASVDNPVEVRLYVERVAQKFGVSDLDAVRGQLRRGLRASRRPMRRSDIRPTRDDISAPRSRKTFPRLQQELLGAILDNPEMFGSEEAKSLEKLLTNSDLRSIFLAAGRMVEERGVIDAPALLSQLGECGAHGWLNERLAIQKYDSDAAKQALRDGIPGLAQRNIEEELPRLQQQILSLRRAGDNVSADALTRERDQLYTSSKMLRQATKG